jgi:hypothetical protein
MITDHSASIFVFVEFKSGHPELAGFCSAFLVGSLCSPWRSDPWISCLYLFIQWEIRC